MIRTTSGRLLVQGLTVIRTTAAAAAATTTTTTTPGGNIPISIRQQNTAATDESQQISNSDKYLHYSTAEGYYKTSPYEPVAPLDITLDKYVWRSLKKWENHVAAVCVVTGRQYTYAEMRDASAAFAVRLQTKFKLNKRDVIAICLPNLPEYPIAVLGAIEAGLSVTTVNPIYTAEEIARQLIQSNTKLIIGTTLGCQVIHDACKLAKKEIPIICVRTRPTDQLPAGTADFYEMINTQDIDFGELKVDDVGGDGMAFLPFSSGTTGLPKGVMLTHNNISVNCEQIQAAVAMNPDDKQDVVPAVLPFFHIYGLTVMMISKLGLGCKLITLPQFKPEDLLKSLYEYRGSVLNLVPPILLFLTNHPKVTPACAPDLRLVMSGAAPIGASDVDRFLKKFPKTRFVQGYGMTESSPCTLMTNESQQRYSSVGFLTGSTEGKIVAFDSEDGKGVGPKISGELCVRGPQVMQGYLHNEEANKEAFYSGKWLRTGDVAYYDDDGYFYITDRMKELIKVKAFQVPPAEIEEILRNHPSIVEAAVVGIPHEQCGEVPKAIVVLKPNCQANEIEIQNFVAEKVAHYKKLEGGVVFVDEIPKNASGKILRRQLKAQYST